MENRLILHDILCDALGSSHVYFQPPESVKMVYPCFVYSLERYPAIYADDGPYKVDEKYLVTFITRDADTLLPQMLCKKHGFSYERYFPADNLHHHVLTYTFY